MPRFGRYIGVRYSGRKLATTPIEELRVVAARGDHEPYEVFAPDAEGGLWSRRGLAEWLSAELAAEGAAVVGLDHAFSFPRTYMERHGVASWDQFLADFAEHWPTQERSVRDLLPGNLRRGGAEERRLTGKWATSRTGGVFRFDSKDGVADAAHAGLPWLGYLRRAADGVHVWPFDGFEVPAGRTVLAEVHAGHLLLRYPREEGSEEAKEAYAICAWLQDRDRADLLSPYFEPPLTPSEREQARLEGWILGVM
jgi:hypothetical protein